jgi:NADH-quinone oxidoreductase subunit A
MTDYIPVVLTFAIGALIVGVMTNLNRLLGPKSHTRIKGTTFECGNEPTGPAWGRFSIKFYIVAILFIVFDVEVVFMYPWAVVYRELGVFGFVEMMVFIAILAAGYVYAWRKGAFEWR